MFTGIIECTGKIKDIRREKENVIFTITSDISNELKVDQSITHNGVCLTVTEIGSGWHSVTAILETLQKTNLGDLKAGDEVNLERCMQLNGRFDGHIVQGHVDQTAKCINIEDQEGSWFFTFEYDATKGNFTVEKGSVTINGTSLTVVNAKDNGFSVAIIPYTFDYTNFNKLKIGDNVNLEFDIIGKYLQKMFHQYKDNLK